MTVGSFWDLQTGALLSKVNMEESSGNPSTQDSYDYLFKFLVIGSAGTGKSCLLHQFIEGRFKEDSSHTIGVEFGSKIVPVGGKTVKLQVEIDNIIW